MPSACFALPVGTSSSSSRESIACVQGCFKTTCVPACRLERARGYTDIPVSCIMTGHCTVLQHLHHNHRAAESQKRIPEAPWAAGRLLGRWRLHPSGAQPGDSCPGPVRSGHGTLLPREEDSQPPHAQAHTPRAPNPSHPPAYRVQRLSLLPCWYIPGSVTLLSHLACSSGNHSCESAVGPARCLPLGCPFCPLWLAPLRKDTARSTWRGLQPSHSINPAQAKALATEPSADAQGSQQCSGRRLDLLLHARLPGLLPDLGLLPPGQCGVLR